MADRGIHARMPLSKSKLKATHSVDPASVSGDRQRRDHKYVVPPPLPPRVHVWSEDIPPPIPTSLRPSERPKTTATVPTRQSLSVRRNQRFYSVPDESVLMQGSTEEDERLTLSELISRYSESFPLRVRVVKGFLGDQGEQNAIASGEVYNIHFVKRTNAVKIKDHDDRNTYTVPFNSAARFGIIYERSDGSSGQPMTFETVGDIMAAVPVPKVACAKRAYRGSDNKSSVKKDEVLVIQGVQKGRFGLGRNTLKVLSVNTWEEKILHRECVGHFTTDPYCTQLYLPEILSNVKYPLPLMAKMYLDVEGEEAFPEYLISEPVKLAEQLTERSLVATPVDEEGDTDDMKAIPNTLVELPTSLDIEVVIIRSKAKEAAKLYESTEILFAKFDPSLLKTCVDVSSDDVYAAESHLRTSIREGHEKEGLFIERPKYQPLIESRVDEGDDYELVRYERSSASPPPTSLSTYAISSLQSKEDHLKHETSQTGAPSLPPRTEKQLPSSPKHEDNLKEDLGENQVPIVPPRRKESEGKESQSSVDPGLPRSPQRKVNIENDLVKKRPPILTPRPNEGNNKAQTTTDAGPLRNPQQKESMQLAGMHLASPTQQNKSMDSDMGSQFDALQSSIQSINSRIAVLESTQNHHSEQLSGMAELSELKHELGNLAPVAQELKRSFELLETEVKEMKTQLAQMVGNQSDHLPLRREKTELATLTQEQLLKLLDILGMAKYRETFAQKSIDGMILAECDEPILQNELGVSSKVDRIKLMKVITGEYSALNIIEGDNYVQFNK